MFAIIIGVLEGLERESITKLMRPMMGEGIKEYELDVYYEGGENCITVSVDEKKITFGEAKDLFDRGYEEIVRIMKERNGSLEKITRDLYLPESVLEEKIKVGWISGNRAYISDNGILDIEACKGIPDKGMIIIMTARLSIQDYSAEVEIPVCISKNVFSNEERREMLITDTIGHVNNESKEMEYVELPTQIDGKDVKFFLKSERSWWKYLAFGIILAMVYILLQKQKEINAKALREKQLRLAFAPVITKLTLLLGAGISIKGAWEKIVNDYKKSSKKNVAYEEMLKIHNEMQNGLSEGQAYVLYGKRCKLSSYIRLGNLLDQNLRKGTKGLAESLKYEVWEAFEDRKELAYRMGEEAGTKLLIPMMLSLGIIIIFCIAPAFLNM